MLNNIEKFAVWYQEKTGYEIDRQLIHDFNNIDKQYVKFYFQGSFFSGETECKIENGKFDIPEYSFAYVLYNKDNGREIDKTGRYYPNAEKFTLEQIKELNDPKLSILISNMESNIYEYVVKTRIGNYQPVMDGDVIMDKYYYRKYKLERITKDEN